ncbi:MAG: energy transducer TonB [Campylobacterales bacterium]|nr:energy transducer TonB [Campylobacterales bacterium]
MSRYFGSFLLTSLIYGGLFTLILYTWDKKIEFTDKTKEARSIEVSLVTLPKPTPEKPAPITPPQEEEPEPKEEPKKVEEKIKKEIPQEVKKEEAVVKKEIPKIEPKSKKVVEKKIVKKEVKKKPKKVALKRPPSNPSNATKSIITKKSNTNAKELAQKKNLYFTTLKNKINSNKSYPNIAKRRGMEGRVKVSFTLSSSGKLINITILSGPKVFHSATRSAIERSLPYAPPKGVFNSTISLTMSVDYKLI